MKGLLAISAEKLSEVEQRLAELYAASTSSAERLKIANALSCIHAAMKSVWETSTAINDLPQDKLTIRKNR